MIDHPSSASLDMTEAVGGAGAKAKRITLTEIKNNIADVRFMVPGDVFKIASLDDPLTRLTLCFVTTRAGFVVVGKSAPLSKDNFDPDKGRTFAYEDCIRQLWPLFAFAELEHQRAIRDMLGKMDRDPQQQQDGGHS